jgi:spore coat polysaccharide biosynthesis protein SpsF (cytidylyltransferase family)
MAFSEFEIAKINKAVNAYIEKHRPAVHLRDEIDLGFRLSDQSVEIFEIRPVWRNESKKMEHPVAKATFTKNQDIWKIYWLRADLKWHRYEPRSEVKTIEEFLTIVEEDDFSCFFG